MLAAHLLSKNILKTQTTLPFQWLNVTIKAVRLSSSSSDSSSDSDTDSESSNKNAGAREGIASSNNVKPSISASSVTNKKGIDYLYTIKEVQKRRQIEKQLTKAAEKLTGKSGEDKEKILATLLDTISNIQHEKSSTGISKINKPKGKVEYKYETEQSEQKYGQRVTEREIRMERNVTEEPSIMRMLQRQLQMTRNMNDKSVVKERYDTEPSENQTLQNQRRETNYDTEPSIIRTLQNQKRETNYDAEPSIIRTLQNQKRETNYDAEPSIIRTLQNQKRETNYNAEPSIIRTLQNQKRETNYNAEPSIIKTLQNQNKRETNYDTEPSVIRALQNQKRETNFDTEPSVIRTLEDQKRKTTYIDEIRQEEENKLSISRMLMNQKINVEKISDKNEGKPDTRRPSVIKALKEQQKRAKADRKEIEKKYEAEKDIDDNVASENKREAEPSVIRSLRNDQRKAWNIDRFEAKRDIQEINQLINDRREAPINYQKIFVNEHLESTAFPELKVWNTCEEKELQSIVTNYPENAIEEMIKWTEEGKLWKFPIDNEQGMEKEHNVHFSEHVFLDRHLTGWCPNKGPIRHFMELVCIGLSKNPYMTIEEKYDHIMWYKDYFKGKTDLLQKLGLVD